MDTRHIPSLTMYFPTSLNAMLIQPISSLRHHTPEELRPSLLRKLLALTYQSSEYTLTLRKMAVKRTTHTTDLLRGLKNAKPLPLTFMKWISPTWPNEYQPPGPSTSSHPRSTNCHITVSQLSGPSPKELEDSFTEKFLHLNNVSNSKLIQSNKLNSLPKLIQWWHQWKPFLSQAHNWWCKQWWPTWWEIQKYAQCQICIKPSWGPAKQYYA